MSSSTARREEYSSSSSNIVRNLNPGRPLSPSNSGSRIDGRELDGMLNNLQSTVNRTAAHLNKSSSSKNVEYLSPSNSTTVVQERRSVSPALKQDGKVYKSSSYEYSSSTRSGGGTLDSRNLSTNVNQLDNLLDDLKHDREVNQSNIGIDDGLLEPNISRTVHTTRSSTRSTAGVPKPLSSPTLVRRTLNQQEARQRSISPNYKSQITRDVTYDTEPVPDYSTQRTYNYSRTSDTKRSVPPYATDIVEVETSELPPELRNVPSDILPQPGTKVTTTIKTFTYEIPADTNVPTNKNFSYKNEFYNSNNTQTTTTNQIYPERDIPPPGVNQSLIYKSESHNTINRSGGPPPGFPNGGVPLEPGVNQTYIYKKETNETTNNVYGRPQRTVSPPPLANSTTIYHSDVSNTTRNIRQPPPGGVQVYPYEPNTLPPHPGAKHTYLYKKESSNTTNTVYGTPQDRHPPENQGPPYGYPPGEPTTAKYLYSSTSTHTTTSHGQPREVITPFPTNGGPPSQVDGGPKHLNELLSNLGDNGREDEPYTPRKEVNTALATNKPVAVVDPKVPTKNIAGPPVYYPPGQELFKKSEESAAWRAGGGYAKAAGKYEYEAESKSKSSSKSGAAVVPVCLPLCCAMPCTIM